MDYVGSTLCVGFPGGTRGKESSCQCRRPEKHEFDPWVGKIPWRRAWQLTPVFLHRDPMDRGAWWVPITNTGSQTVWHYWSDLACMHALHYVLGNIIENIDKNISCGLLIIPKECVCLVTQSCLTLCDPLDCNPLGSSVHGFLQTTILEWVAISFSRESSWLRGWTWISCIAGRLFTSWATREVPINCLYGEF